MVERKAKLNFNDWAGCRSVEVIVVGETPKKYRIKTAGEDPIRLAGRYKYLRPGEVALVPKSAVTIEKGEC